MLFRYAVVTGSNKGIGFESVKMLASNGVKVVLTARDEKKGHEAIEKLKQFGLSDQVMFHQLDVTDSASITSLVQFFKTQFGRLDILVRFSYVWFGGEFRKVTVLLSKLQNVAFGKITLTYRDIDNRSINK